MTHKIPAIGSRAMVMHGNAKHTSGGLTKKDLAYNKWGRIVSKEKQKIGRKLYRKYRDEMEENRREF